MPLPQKQKNSRVAEIENVRSLLATLPKSVQIQGETADGRTSVVCVPLSPSVIERPCPQSMEIFQGPDHGRLTYSSKAAS